LNRSLGAIKNIFASPQLDAVVIAVVTPRRFFLGPANLGVRKLLIFLRGDKSSNGILARL
jgi:hypothetical protein